MNDVAAHTTRISWKARALAAEALLARQMWIAAELTKASDPVAGIQAVEEWDNDRLLADVYEQYLAAARTAIEATT